MGLILLMTTTAALGSPPAAPQGWQRSQQESLLLYESPERDSRIVVLQLPTAGTDASRAVATLWRQLGRPAPALVGQTPLADAQGWQQRRSLSYASGAGDRSLELIRQRTATTWSLLLLDLSLATADRRSAALTDIIEGVQAPGYQRETFAGRRALPLDAARLRQLSAFVAKAQRQLQVPGVALGVLEHDQVVLAEGHGLRRLGEPARIDADTLFMVGSTTKPLTSLLLATLVDQGRLTWSTPVRQLLPELRLADADLTARLEVHHLLCACSGVPRRDLLWLLGDRHATAAAALGSLALVRPTSGFGEVFQYNNQLVAAGGYLAGQVAHPQLEIGAAYDRAMAEQLFAPLGMASTTLDFDQALRQPNRAWPHGFDHHDRLAVVPDDVNRTLVPIRPAGAVWSNVNDLLRYVALELRDGRLIDGRPLLSPQALRQRWQPQVSAGGDSFYGLGLVIDRSLGTDVLMHNGATFGYQSLLFWLPQLGIGAVLLTNGDQGNALAALVQRRLLELVFAGRPEAETNLTVQAATLARARAEGRRGLRFPAEAGAVPPAGRYRSAGLAPLTVLRRDGGTRVTVGWIDTPMASRGPMSLATTLPGLFGLVVERSGTGGRILKVMEAQHTYRFEAE